MVSGNSIGPAISNSRVGTVSGQDKFDALSLRGNSAGGSAASDATDKQGKIKAGDLLDKKDQNTDDTGEQAKEADSGDKSKATTGTDSVQEKAIKDGTNQAVRSRLEEMKNTPFPPENPDPGMMPPQNQGMDPAMMAALAGKGSGSGGGGSKPSSGGSPQKPSSSSGSQALKDQMQKMNDKFTDALKDRDAKIQELSKKQAAGSKPETGTESTQPRGLGGENRGIDQLKEYTANLGSTDAMEKATARNNIAQNLTNESWKELGEENRTKIKEAFGGMDNLNKAVNDAKGSNRSEESANNEVYKLDADQTKITEYDPENNIGDELNLHSSMVSSQRENDIDLHLEENISEAITDEIEDIDFDEEALADLDIEVDLDIEEEV